MSDGKNAFICTSLFLGQALPPGQQLMIVNAQGQLQPLTPEQLATVRMQQALVQQQQQPQQQIVQTGGQEITQSCVQIGGQAYAQSSIGGNAVSTEMLEQQQSSTITTMQVSSAQTASSMQLQQQQQIQLLSTSQASSSATQMQQSSLPQQQIIQTVNGQQVLIQTPQVGKQGRIHGTRCAFYAYLSPSKITGDGPTDRRTDGRTHPLIDLRRRI